MIEKAPEQSTAPLTFLPTWLPGETLYSLSARYHRLSANRLAADTSQQLYGAKNAGFWHDFPSRLGCFVERTQGRLGAVELLAKRHTLLGFYAPFRTKEEIAAAISAMASASVRDLKFKLGLPASRVGADHPLKVCPDCVEEDRQTEGGAYWHLEHQWPSIWHCPRHDRLLYVCLARNKTRNHLQWILPDDVEPASWWQPPLINVRARAFIVRLAKITADLQERPIFEIDPERFRNACLAACRRRGWLHESRGVLLLSIQKAFFVETVGINVFPGMNFLAGVGQEGDGFVGMMLRRARGRKHPLKQLLLICLLFDDWLTFRDIYASEPKVAPIIDPRRLMLASMVRQEKVSISEAARRLGLSVDKAVYWAKKDGVPYRKRPRLVDKEKALLIADALRNGDECLAVAARLGVPVATVRRYLDNHADVRFAWNWARGRHSLQ